MQQRATFSNGAERQYTNAIFPEHYMRLSVGWLLLIENYEMGDENLHLRVE